MPSGFLTAILNAIELDNFFNYSNLYYDNGPKYHISLNNMPNIITHFILCILAHLLVHFNLTKPILLPLTEDIFKDGSINGAALLTASLLAIRISWAILNLFEWKKKSIDFNNSGSLKTAQRLKIDNIDFSKLTVADCINKHLNNNDIIIW